MVTWGTDGNTGVQNGNTGVQDGQQTVAVVCTSSFARFSYCLSFAISGPMQVPWQLSNFGGGLTKNLLLFGACAKFNQQGKEAH